MGNSAIRFEKYLSEKGVLPSSAERLMDCSNGLLGKAFKSGKPLSGELIEKILKAFPDINSDWLILGKGNRKNANELNNNPTNMDKDEKIQSLNREIESLNRIIANQEREIREYLRMIADLRRDVAIDTQKKAIALLEEDKQDLEEKLGINRKRPKVKFTKREEDEVTK